MRLVRRLGFTAEPQLGELHIFKKIDVHTGRTGKVTPFAVLRATAQVDMLGMGAQAEALYAPVYEVDGPHTACLATPEPFALALDAACNDVADRL